MLAPLAILNQTALVLGTVSVVHGVGGWDAQGWDKEFAVKMGLRNRAAVFCFDFPQALTH